MQNLKSALVCVRLSSQALSLLTLAFALPIDAATSGLEFVPNEVIVQYRPGAKASQGTGQVQSRLMRSSHKAMLLSQHQRSDGKGDLALVQLPLAVTSNQEMAKTIAQLEQDPTVEYVEPNWVYHKLDTGLSYRQDLAKTYQHQYLNFPNDLYYRNGESWGMYGDKTLPTNPYGSHAGEAWVEKHKPLDCSDVYIGVIDEGIMKQHPDLKDSIWVNRFDPLDGIDNDGNGYVDDSNGWDFYYNDRTVYHEYEEFHGSHVAGIIAAQGNNRMGVAGVCWKAKLISAKFLGPDGGDTVNAIKSIDYITDLKVRHGLNIVATNNSWGGGGYSRAMIDAIKRAEKANILFIAAAGNDGTDNDPLPLYPASYPNANIISVTSITQDGLLSGGANIGTKSVDIAAPGEGILSTVPNFEGKPDYGYDGGTSMAAPFVTGATALYAHKHPKAHYLSTKRAILSSAEPTADFVGLTVTGGRLDVSRMAKR
jgi:subtilisin family serine protease